MDPQVLIAELAVQARSGTHRPQVKTARATGFDRTRRQPSLRRIGPRRSRRAGVLFGKSSYFILEFIKLSYKTL